MRLMYTDNHQYDPPPEEAAMKLAHKSYPSFTKITVDNFSVDTTKAFADVIKEVKVICSDKANSILK